MMHTVAGFDFFAIINGFQGVAYVDKWQHAKIEQGAVTLRRLGKVLKLHQFVQGIGTMTNSPPRRWRTLQTRF